MYVKKEELREAVVARIAEVKGEGEKPAVKTSGELRAEYNVLCTTLAARQSKRLTEYAKAHLKNLQVDAHGFSAHDGYNTIRVDILLTLDAEERDRLIAEQDEIKAASQAWRDRYDQEYYGNRNKRSDYAPASLRELEAWLTRIDNDIKTATVNIRRDFASELGLV